MNYVILASVVIAVILAILPGRSGRRMSFEDRYSWLGKGRDEA